MVSTDWIPIKNFWCIEVQTTIWYTKWRPAQGDVECKTRPPASHLPSHAGKSSKNKTCSARYSCIRRLEQTIKTLFCPCLESKNEVLNLENPSYPANKILRNLETKRSVRIIKDSHSIITANRFITQYCLYSKFGPPWICAPL